MPEQTWPFRLTFEPRKAEVSLARQAHGSHKGI